MSKIFVIFLVVCVALAACKSRKKQTIRQPGYCLNKGKQIKEGELLPAPAGKCKAVKCINAELNTVKTLTCNAKDMGKNCAKVTKGVNRSLIYPACCPKFNCDTE